MAASVTLNSLDFLTYDEQAALEELLEQPLSETKTDNEKKGWSIRFSPAAFVNCYKAPQLATGFINLCQNTYSLISMPSMTPTKRVNTGGNFCGHNPAKPRFVMQNHAYFAKQDIDDLGNKRRPQILYDIVEQVKAYYHDPDVIPVLQHANGHKRTSDKQRRSEIREAIVSLLSVMIMNMDLGSLRVGQPMLKGGFFNYSLEWLADKAKISESRAKNAISNIKNAMIITSYQYRELIDKEKKEYIAHNASRVFDMDFFKLLEIDLQKLGKARKVSHQKQKDKQAKSNAKEDAVARLNMKKVMNSIEPQNNKLKSVNLPENEEVARQENRRHKRRTQVFLELREDPRYQHDDAVFEAELQRRLADMNLLHPQEHAT
jgi:hypothetical protein